MSKIINITSPPQEQITLSSTGIFFAGQEFDAWQSIKTILETAQSKIIIIDGYINNDVLNILTPKATNVQVHILTKKLTPDISSSAEKFNQQYKNLHIRLSSAFHDRFIWIDEQSLYHFGASLKDAGKQGFMFSRIEEPKMITSFKGRWKHEWENAESIITPANP